jgi:hypothetical protein
LPSCRDRTDNVGDDVKGGESIEIGECEASQTSSGEGEDTKYNEKGEVLLSFVFCKSGCWLATEVGVQAWA